MHNSGISLLLLDIEQSGGTGLDLVENAYDWVYSSRVLHALESKKTQSNRSPSTSVEGYIKTSFKMLKRNGVFFGMTVATDKKAEYTIFNDRVYHRKTPLLTSEELQEYLQKTGFIDIEISHMPAEDTEPSLRLSFSARKQQ